MTAHCRLGTLLVVLAIVVGSPGLAAANMANPVMAGDPVGEPSGELKQVAIERETLDLDLRPLSDDQPTRISATYAVRNDGPAASLDLLFIAPGLAARSPSDFGVWLDDASVPATIAPNLTLPSSWRPPATTPGLDGKGSLSYLTRSDRGLRFSLAMPPGAHRIRVRYPATATAYSADSPVRYWQLGYVLAPAKNWASFGTLDVSVEVPPGWGAATSPPLARQGDALKGSFAGIPADDLGITVQAPVPAPVVDVDPAPVLAVGGLAIALALGALAGRWLARRRRSYAWSLLVAVVATGAWVLLAVAVLAIAASATVAPPGQDAWTYGYGRGSAVLAVMLAAIVLGPIASLGAALIAYRKTVPHASAGG